MRRLSSFFERSSVKANLAANFFGRFIQAFCTFFFIPFYILFIGVESYGLMAIYASLQVALSILDFGLSSALNRELASSLENPEKLDSRRDLVRSLEIIYSGIGLVTGLCILALAPFLAHNWLKANALSPRTVEITIMLMGLVIGIQFPTILYSGGLMGMQRQVTLNMISSGFAILKGLGAILVLWGISPTVEMFWAWQLLVGFLQTLTLRNTLWGALPASSHAPSFRLEIIREIWRFAAGLAGINLLAVILTQVDKIVLSKLLTLEQFGYYTLATTASSGLYLFIQPVFSTVFPRFSQLLAEKKTKPLSDLYHTSCQTLSVLIFPLTLMLCLFPSEILFLWTRNPAVVAQGSSILSIHVIGTALNGLMNLPYALQLASGWTRLAFFLNLGSAVFMIPLIIFLTQKFQLIGAALGWVILNAIYVTIGVQLMHRRLLPGEKWRWYGADILLPAIGAGLPVLLFRPLIPGNESLWLLTGELGLLWLSSLVGASLMSGFLRDYLWKRLISRGADKLPANK